MPLFRLRNTEQRIDFGIQNAQGAAPAKSLEEDTRIRAGKGQLGFFPDPVRNQRIDFAVVHHAAHQLHRFVGHRESEGRKSRCEPRHAQDSDGIFDECVADVPQQFVFDVGKPTPRVDYVAVLVLRDSVDRQVTAAEVFFNRYFGRAVKFKPMVAGACLALGSGERILFARFGVEEHGKIFADTPVSQGFQLRRCGAHDTPVPLLVGNAELRVSYGATYEIDLHRVIVPE